MLTLEQLNFISEAHAKGLSLDTAKESLIKDKAKEMYAKHPELPKEDKRTERYINDMAKAAAKNFLAELAVALRHLATEVKG